MQDIAQEKYTYTFKDKEQSSFKGHEDSPMHVKDATALMYENDSEQNNRILTKAPTVAVSSADVFYFFF